MTTAAVHAGMYRAATWLVDENSNTLRTYAEDMGYSVVITGHSLGLICISLVLCFIYPSECRMCLLGLYSRGVVSYHFQDVLPKAFAQNDPLHNILSLTRTSRRGHGVSGSHATPAAGSSCPPPPLSLSPSPPPLLAVSSSPFLRGRRRRSF